MIPCAYLRVFEPLTAFPAAERQRWHRDGEAGRWMSVGDAVRWEARITASRLVTGHGQLVADAALVRRDSGVVRICPLQLELRAAFALHEFRQVMPDVLVDAFVDEDTARQAMTVLDATVGVPHIKESPWTVPLEWFVLFHPDDRQASLDERGAHADGGRGGAADGRPAPTRVSYVVAIVRAQARLRRVQRVLAQTVDDATELLLALEELTGWLDAFDDDSLVELDYGGVADLLTAAELAEDATCEDVREAVDELEAGNPLGAVARYGVARGRWARLRARERVN